MNARKERAIRYTAFTIGITSIGVGVVLLTANVPVGAIIFLTLGIVITFLSVMPYPNKRQDDNEDNEEL